VSKKEWELLQSQIKKVKDRSAIDYLCRTSYLWRCLFFKDRYSELTKESVLDVGCFIGAIGLLIPSKIYIGIDHSKEAIKQARILNKRVHFIVGNAVTIPIRDCTIKTVIASELIEYLKDPKEFVEEMKRVLCEGGYLVLVVPSPYSLFPLVKKIRKWRSPKRYLAPREVLMILGAVGFRLDEYRGFQLFDPVLNFFKMFLAKPVSQLVRFEQMLSWMAVIDSWVAQKLSILASKHLYVARKENLQRTTGSSYERLICPDKSKENRKR
jgi:SAM-dependent methyltransferase